jgi:hypothetical protein
MPSSKPDPVLTPTAPGSTGNGKVELPFEEFASVSSELMNAYLALIRRGMPEKSIAFAMVGATVNLYHALNIIDELPDILRAVADRVEQPAI